MVGRFDDLSLLRDRLEKAVNGKGGTVFIEGEAGIGKTRLISELSKEAEKKEVEVIKGWCLPENLEPLMPVREAFRNSDLSHLIARKAPPRVISVYLTDAGGMLVAKAESQATDLDADIFATMLNAVGNFVTDSLSMMGRDGKGLNVIGYGTYSILIETLGTASLACVIEGTQNEFLIEDMRRVLKDMENRLDDWDGDISKVKDLEQKISWFIYSGKYDGEFLVDNPKLKQENLFDNVLMGLQRMSQDRPSIFFIDDLQWADPTTLNLLHYLARNIRENRILIVGTYRPEEIMDSPEGEIHKLKITMQDMSRENLFEKVDLQRLDIDMTGDIVESALEDAELGGELIVKVHDETEGNPLFVLEMIKLLVEENLIVQNKDDKWKLSTDIDELKVPSKVYDVIKRRLNRLKMEQRDIMECACIEGEEFRSEIIGEVLDISRLKLLKNLNEIERTHKLIHSISNRYRFDHTKITEVLYQGMTAELRREYHRMVGDTIKKIYRDKAMNELAHHYYKAEDERAGHYLTKAGNDAKERFANSEAIHLYQLSIETLDKNEDRVDVLGSIGEVYTLIGEYDRAIESFNDAVHLTEDTEEKAKNLRKLAEAHMKKGEFARSLEVTDTAQEFLKNIRSVEKGRSLVLEGKIYYGKGDFGKAMLKLSEAVKLFEKLGEERDLGNAIRAVGNIYLNKGEFDKALEHYEKSLLVMETVKDPIGIASALNNIGIVYQDIGKTDRALDFYKRSLDIEKKIGNKWGIAQSLNNLGIVHRNMGQPDRALEFYRHSLRIKEKIGDKQGIADTRNNIGQIHRSNGEMDKALEFYEESKSIYEEIGDEQGVSTSLNNIGRLLLSQGRIEQAVEFYKQSLEIREGMDNRWSIAQSLNYIGEADHHQGILDDALDSYSQSLDICQEIEDRSLMIQTLCGLSEVYLEMGDVQTAYERTGKALEIAVEIDAKIEKGIGHRIRGMIHREKDEIEQAIEEFKKAENLFKDADVKIELARLYYEYAVLLKRSRRLKRCDEYLNRALDLYQKKENAFWVKKCKDLQ